MRVIGYCLLLHSLPKAIPVLVQKEKAHKRFAAYNTDEVKTSCADMLLSASHFVRIVRLAVCTSTIS